MEHIKMSQQHNSNKQHYAQYWRPTATFAALQARAELLRTLRNFFATRGVLEVETPVLAQHGVTDVNLEPIIATQAMPASKTCKKYYLQTSPEYAMKRLLAVHKCCMFQIGKAFRNDEQGKLHNPEFTILEWYRVGFDHFALMNEMDELLQLVLQTRPARQVSYQTLFLEFLQLDPLTASVVELQQCCQRQGIDLYCNSGDMDKDDWLSLLLTHCIEPKLQGDSPWMIYDYPCSQAALAQLNPTQPEVAQRFEVYINGIELANGYHELGNSEQHRERFNQDNKHRLAKGKPQREIDEYLLHALAAGLPACAGVALGLDRLLMLKLGAVEIGSAISFPINRS